MHEILRQRPVDVASKIKQYKDDSYNFVDMHIHTECSDGKATLYDARFQAERYGIGLAITDHAGEPGCLDNTMSASSMDGILAIPATEITTDDGTDVLVYFNDKEYLQDFYDKHVKDNHGGNKGCKHRLGYGLEDVLDITGKDYDGLCMTSLAHPYAISKGLDRRLKKEKILSKADCIEAINGGMTKERNRNAQELAERYGMPITCGSDSHNIERIGYFLTGTQADNASDFLDNIKDGKDTILIGSEYMKSELDLFFCTLFLKNARYAKRIAKKAIIPS